MRTLFTKTSMNIEPGEAISGVAKDSQTLRIATGRVWITVEGIPHDYFLHAGDSFTAIPGRLIVVEADSAAQIERQPAADPLSSLHRLLSAARQLTRTATVQATMQRHHPCSGPC